MTSEVHDNPEAYIYWLYINTKRDRKKNDANLVCRSSNNNVSILLFKREDILGYCGAGMSAYKKSLKIPKGQSESVYRRRTDNTMVKSVTIWKVRNYIKYIIKMLPVYI
jgi:hypothetical protein